MGAHLFEYMVIGLFGLLAIFAFFLGVEKMVKLIVGNYILVFISLSLFVSLSILIQYLGENPQLRFLGILNEKRQGFFESGQTTIVLLVYAGLMILLFTKVRIGLHFPGDELKKNAIMVLLIPLTVLSVVFALEIALLGNKVFIVEELVKFATEAATNDILYNFLVLTPVRISIHALLTFLITLELEVQYNPPAMPFEEDVE